VDLVRLGGLNEQTDVTPPILVAAGGTSIAAPAAANVFATRNAAEADQTGNQAKLFAGCCAEPDQGELK
jgi:hypothetical protein